jgi:hypothetical protein
MPANPLFNVAQQITAKWTFFKGPQFLNPPILPSYTVATIPSAATSLTGAIIFVSDAASGANFQGCTGTVWVNLG